MNMNIIQIMTTMDISTTIRKQLDIQYRLNCTGKEWQSIILRTHQKNENKNHKIKTIYHLKHDRDYKKTVIKIFIPSLLSTFDKAFP